MSQTSELIQSPKKRRSNRPREFYARIGRKGGRIGGKARTAKGFASDPFLASEVAKQRLRRMRRRKKYAEQKHAEATTLR